ncbi:MAG: hypothetical protein M1814_000489 [Vezdaea aestivalis]|nr:MAG: hypothetical protein M1814_000489 [Vezdaea aestivalis]
MIDIVSTGDSMAGNKVPDSTPTDSQTVASCLPNCLISQAVERIKDQRNKKEKSDNEDEQIGEGDEEGDEGYDKEGDEEGDEEDDEEGDEEGDEQGDEGYESEIDSQLTDVSPDVLEGVQEFGRQYPYYKEVGFRPCDEEERNRSTLEHFILRDVFGLKQARLGNFRYVLDVNSRSGAWSREFGETYTRCKVIGIDTSPLLVSDSRYAEFRILDIEDPWHFRDSFDYIHFRGACGMFRDMSALFAQAYNNLNPGGWIEVVDILFFEPQNLDLGPDSQLLKWCEQLGEAHVKIGRPLYTADKVRGMIADVGFSNIQVEERLFTGQDNSGEQICDLFERGLYAFCAAPFIKGLGYSITEVKIFIARVKTEILEMRCSSLWKVISICGQVPARETSMEIPLRVQTLGKENHDNSPGIFGDKTLSDQKGRADE